MISIVIPTHNRKSTIKRAINSVVNQTFQDIEIIVVSDGSSDGTNELVQELAISDERIKLIAYPEPKGGNYARNTGAKASKSEYIAFLDDDDEWFPNKLEKEIELFKNDTDIGLVYTGIKVIYENDGYSYISLPNYEGDLSREILLHNCITTTSSVMIKKSVLEKAGYFDERLPALQDFDLWIRCCQFAKVGCVRDALLNYYINANVGQITANTDKNNQAFELIEEKYKQLYEKLSVADNKTRLCNRFCGLAKYALKNSEGKKCRQFAVKAYKQKKSIRAIIIYFSSFIGIKTILKIRKMIRK